MIFKTTGQLCFGFGYDTDQVILQLQTMFNMQDCYKTMISDLCDWSSTFMGKDAKWLDSCSPSVGSNLITIKKWIISEAL